MASLNIINDSNDDIKLYIYRPQMEKMYQIVVAEPVVWTTEQAGTPSKLEFTVIKYAAGDELSFQEGDTVIFKYKGNEVFRGIIFTKQRDKDHHIACTAYDSLRYFKNEVSPRALGLHQGMTTTEVLNWVCATKANSFTKGHFDDSKINVVWNEVEPKTLFDIIEHVEDQTRMSDPNHTVYTLYDDCGKLYYKSSDDENMKLNLVIDETSLENFSYTTSIDNDTYNTVLLYWDDDEGSTTTTKKTTSEPRNTAGSEPYDAIDEQHVKDWGVLQLTKKIDSSIPNPEDVAKKLLEQHNKKSRDLTLQGCFGDVRARAGRSVILYLYLGDIQAQNYAFITKARHTFEHKFHTMDLDVIVKLNEKGAV